MAMPQASVGRVKLDLSSSFFDIIQALGKGISPQFTPSKWSQMINSVSSSQLCCWTTSENFNLRGYWQLMPQCSPLRKRQWQQRTNISGWSATI